ncbi:hypothetical protein [Proteus mirabilis]|uniref:hypothetical protein n=1 Tax=Proteus mirabilis TaxID=584 RepID=UPI001BA27532|nr:hypothetical protein [Proteus mirabilis]MDC5889184.1 hypothetical protein [Proteus mirabilis]MDC5896265.1 hypothetical protein [Proteus mirabilis]MDC5906781.1 hypothetical protein [Proteus mirabilis]MDC5910321.1 hypothetical protein [Proteus mirabilis]MDC5917400.1 hypothetical protein [Proteus mirabilis]
MLTPTKNSALEYLKSHPSTKEFHIETIGQFFTYLKDSILSLFNSDHKFSYLGNMSVADFNLMYIRRDLHTFLTNPFLNKSEHKDKVGALQYSFDYLQNQAHITPNLYNVYRSGNFEPNELISQLINYGNKLIKNNLSTEEAQHGKYVIETLKEVLNNLEKLSNTEKMRLRILSIVNERK